MDKNSTYQQKFLYLKEWFPGIVEPIKKDLRQDHLRQDIAFFKKYFNGKNFNKITQTELAEGYLSAIEKDESSENLSEFMANRWLLKHSDVYYFFEKKLTEVNPNFSELEKIDDQLAEAWVKESVASFGAFQTYVFSVLNGVVFSKAIFSFLEEMTKNEQTAVEVTKKNQEEAKSKELLCQSYEQQIARLTDRFEKKILGLQKKYLQDTEALKRQLVNLQKKITKTAV